jgi:protein O-mannosyl-transferase
MPKQVLPAAKRSSHPPSKPAGPSIWALPAFFILLLILYAPALGGGLLWDDAGHLTAPHLQSLHGLWRIWTDLGATQQYYPLAHSAFWLQSHLWGSGTTGHHVVNVALHAASSFLLVLILLRLGFQLRTAFVAALLFAVHPVHVESVAWMTELKNTLSLALGLGALLWYLRFDQDRARRSYAIAILLFVGSLLAKTVSAMLAPALLVLVWWRRGRIRWREDARPLLPMFVVGAAAGLLTAWVERHFIGATGSEYDLNLVERVMLAGRAVWFYALKLVLPFNLSFIYPRWDVDASQPWQLVFPAALIGVMAGLWLWRRRARGPLAVLLLFVIVLFPALGFVNVYPFRYSYVADHFQYHASIALIAGVTALLGIFLKQRTHFLAIVALPLAVLTFLQARHYRSAEALYRATIERNPSAWMAHNNLGMILANDQRFAEARPHFERAIQLNSGVAEHHMNLGRLLLAEGRTAEAINPLREAVRLEPNAANARSNLGVALMRSGDLDDAVTEFEQALRVDAQHAEAKLNLATAQQEIGVRLARGGAVRDALPHFEAAVRYHPIDPGMHYNLGMAYFAVGRRTDAMTALEQALALDPGLEAARALLQQLRGL